MKTSNFLYIILIFSALLFSSCNQKKSNDSQVSNQENVVDTFPKITSYSYPKNNKSISKDKIEIIKSFYYKNWARNNMSGSFLVAHEGKILFESYSGYANYKAKDTIVKETPLHLASVSKFVTATAIMKLVDAQKIALDQKVNTILSNFPYENITVRMLLNHRSGLQNYAYYFDDRSIWDHRQYLTNQDILENYHKNKVALNFKPDTKFAYCNTNYAMLALIIEKVTGLKYDVALQKMIFEPLKMTHTYVATQINQVEKYSQSYKNNYQLHALDHLDEIYGDKNIYSTPRDLLKFDNAISNPAFINPKLISEIYSGYSYEHKGKKNYGLGIRMLEFDNGKTLYFHNGWWHGNTTSYVKLKDEKILIIALSNKYSKIPYKSYLLSTLFGNYPLDIKNTNLID